MSLKKNLILLATLICTVFVNHSFAETIAPLSNKSLILLAPPVINKDYFLFEYGFVVNKNLNDYQYNAYVAIAFFEESPDRLDNLKAGALGFKGGVLLPVYREIPVSFKLGAGFARSVLHHNPFLGKDEQTTSKNNMILIESGLLYHHDQYSLGITYQRNTIDYFTRKLFLNVGVNY